MIRSDILQTLIDNHHSINKVFWTEVQNVGTPLIERCLEPSKRLVTFLFKANDAENVVLLSSINRQDIKVNRLVQYAQSDLWYLSVEVDSDLRTRYLFSPNDSLHPLTDDDVLSQRSNATCIDPYNSQRHKLLAYEDDPEDEKNTVYSVLELPDAPTLACTKVAEGLVKGVVSKHRFRSKELNNERSIWLYRPPIDTSLHNPKLLIFFDGWNYTTAIPTPTILDNLIDQARLEATFAVFIEHDLWQDREIELGCNDRFTRFLANEVLLWCKKLTGCSFSAKKTTLAGSSLGGVAACYSALKRPDLFGNVIGQSCSVMWRNNQIVQEYAAKDLQNVKLYLDMGSQEYCHTAEKYSTELMSEFINVLKQKNYDFRYREYNGGHDYPCWAASLSEWLQNQTH